MASLKSEGERLATLEAGVTELRTSCAAMNVKLDRVIETLPAVKVNEVEIENLTRRVNGVEENIDSIHTRMWTGLVGIVLTLMTLIGKIIADAVSR